MVARIVFHLQNQRENESELGAVFTLYVVKEGGLHIFQKRKDHALRHVFLGQRQEAQVFINQIAERKTKGYGDT